MGATSSRGAYTSTSSAAAQEEPFRGCPASIHAREAQQLWHVVSHVLREQDCQHAQRNVLLSQCLNLAPAGTGTQSLLGALSTISSNAARLDVAHSGRISETRHAPCYVMTLRDPATRMSSAYRYAQQMRTVLRPPPQPTARQRAVPAKPSLFISGFPSAMQRNDSLAAAYYSRAATGASGTAYTNLISQYGAVANFFISQAEYLRGLDCSRASVHFVCTDDFDADWTALHRVFNRSTLSSAAVHRNARGTRGELAQAASNRTHRRVFSAAHERLVRECLYPWDAHLHRAICERKARTEDDGTARSTSR